MKAIISTGSKQYLVSKGDKLRVELLDEKLKTAEFEALAMIDGTNSKFGNTSAVVKAKVLDRVRDDKVTSIRYKAKKRVHKKRGHRQEKSLIEITEIS